MAAGGVGDGQEFDALIAARFEFSIDGHSVAQFSELSGISSAVDVVEFIESTAKETILKKLPGKPQLPTIVVKRGMTKNIEMATWHQLVVEGDVAAARKSCSLTMFNTKGAPVARYHLTDAWPAKIEIGALKAGASEVLIETVTFACERIQRVSV